MFYHLVIFTQKKEAEASEIKKALANLCKLLDSTSEVKGWSVDKVLESRPEAFHYIQYTVFDHKSGLDSYRSQPNHKVVKQKLKELFDYQVVDY